MSVSKLKEILDEIQYPILVEIVDHEWFKDSYPSICWNTKGDFDDLSNTFSVETIGSGTNYDGYFIINAYSGCGEAVTYFFNLSKEVKF